ncbi:MAG: hypothetical protein ACK532_10695, partial [Acidobacteriota bacterium]
GHPQSAKSPQLLTPLPAAWRPDIDCDEAYCLDKFTECMVIAKASLALALTVCRQISYATAGDLLLVFCKKSGLAQPGKLPEPQSAPRLLGVP